jgi:cell shape-determining protein MreD
MLFFLLLLIILILIEGTITTLPLVLVCLLCLTIYKREAIVFPIAFLSGLFLDILRVNFAGASSVFFIVFVFLILLYQKKYEINSYPFVAFAGFLGSLGYLGIFGGGNLFIQPLISSGAAVVLFAALRWSFLRRQESGI